MGPIPLDDFDEAPNELGTAPDLLTTVCSAASHGSADHRAPRLDRCEGRSHIHPFRINFFKSNFGAPHAEKRGCFYFAI